MKEKLCYNCGVELTEDNMSEDADLCIECFLWETGQDKREE